VPVLIALLLLVSCGHYQRHVQQHRQSEERQQERWEARASEAKNETTAQQGTTTKKRAKAVKDFRRDGTLRRETIVLDDETAAFLASRVASATFTAQAAGELDREKKDTSDKLSDVGVKTGLPWYVWTIGAAVVAGLLGLAVRRWGGTFLDLWHRLRRVPRP
jgi:hypothetical protein